MSWIKDTATGSRDTITASQTLTCEQTLMEKGRDGVRCMVLRSTRRELRSCSVLIQGIDRCMITMSRLEVTGWEQ